MKTFKKGGRKSRKTRRTFRKGGSINKLTRTKNRRSRYNYKNRRSRYNYKKKLSRTKGSLLHRPNFNVHK